MQEGKLIYLHASIGVDGVSLTLVLGHQGVHVVNHIGTDGGSEHSGQSNSASHTISGLNIENRNNGTTHLKDVAKKYVQDGQC